MKFTFAPESRPLDGYTIKRAIARGGFGEVYYALTDSGKEVALKLLQENLEVELRGVTQCLNLKHPNLVTLFDIKQDAEGDHWIVMEYVGGKTLDRVIHEHPSGMPLDDVLTWLDGIAAGIGFLHDRGIVHRDLKPANIFRESGTVKIGDVGLSKFIAPSRRSAHTQSVGTVYYMAPEVAKGRYGRQVDVYSLAVILYEMLTGKVPFDGETTAEILMKHLTERPNLSPIAPKLRPVFEAALEKDPQRRTSDVLELARQFRALAAGLPVVEPAVELLAPAPPPALEHADTQPFEKPTDAPLATASPRPSLFPESSRPKSGWPAFADWCRRTVQSLRDVARTHPLLTSAAVAMLIAWTVSRSTGIRVSQFAGGTRLVWLVLGSVVAFEVFRLVSRGVDWLFAPPSPRNSGGPADSERRSGAVSSVSQTNGPRSSARVLDRRLSSNSVRDLSWRRRLTELSGSLATAGLTTAALTGVLAYVTRFFDSTALIGQFAAGTLIGSWSLLILGKLREGLPRERYIDRMLLAVVGVLVGAALFQLDGWLLIDLPADGWSQKQSLLAMTSTSLSDNPRRLLAESYVAFFATLFALRRWWWQTDSYRPQRFRVLSVCMTAIVGAIAARLWGFPVLWGTVWAASLSSVVQLAAVWTPYEQRR